MAFDPDTKEKVSRYINAHLEDEAWHLSYFDFLTDKNLARRLGEEFISTRYIYKYFEGIGAKDWLQRAQVRIQVLCYASIYEAVIHHLLFVNLATNPHVIALTEFPTKKQIFIPTDSLTALAKHLKHDGKDIIPMFEAVGKTEETKIRFDKKAKCAQALGIVEKWLSAELIEFYEARNAIHIHAEIRKSLSYEIDLARRAYMRLLPFKEQIIAWQSKAAV
ncbi:MAG: hypothetical protein ACN6OU_01810 [Stenotrophomonas acidaminiphila]